MPVFRPTHRECGHVPPRPKPAPTAVPGAVGWISPPQPNAPESFMEGRSWIHTFSGHQFWPMEARGTIVVEDIAHALSMECRYSGHCERFYSVAEHSVRVAEILRQRGAPRPLIFAGLLHDASEAYLKDIPRPLKVRSEFAGYRAAEERLQARIYATFGLDDQRDWFEASVKRADRAVYGYEVRRLFSTIPTDQLMDLPPDLVEFQEGLMVGWRPADAETLFLRWFGRYAGGRL